jgi:hypothetical protein
MIKRFALPLLLPVPGLYLDPGTIGTFSSLSMILLVAGAIWINEYRIDIGGNRYLGGKNEEDSLIFYLVIFVYTWKPLKIFGFEFGTTTATQQQQQQRRTVSYYTIYI